MEDDNGSYLDYTCFKAGLCTDSPETFLEELERKLTTGEIVEHEAKQFYQDHIKMKGRIVNVVNLFDVLLNPKKTRRELMLHYKVSINALTSAAISAMLGHIAALRRGEDPTRVDSDPRLSSEHGTMNDGHIASQNGENTLDERNAADIEAAGTDFNKQFVEDLGFTSTVPPFKIAEICDGIRHTLYKKYGDLLSGDENTTQLEPEAALYRTPPSRVTDKPNFNQPMSVQFNLNYRVRMAGVVNEVLVQRGVKNFNRPEEFVREALKEQGLRDGIRLAKLLPEVVTELESFDTPYDEDMFTNLPLDTQLRIGQKIAATLNNEYKRLFPIALRTGDLAMSADLEIIEANFKEISGWCLNTEKLVDEEKAKSSNTNAAMTE